MNFDQRQYAVHAAGRALPTDTVAMWADAFARHAPPARPLEVLDLGSGTGRFSPVLAERFGGPVFGVEPHDRMRAAAEADATHPDVTYLAGSAERLPLPDASCDLVLLYLVWHHVVDRAAAVAEIARVLRPGGRVLRGAFRDRMPELAWHGRFPGARTIEHEVFPALGDVTAEFSAAGLRRVALERLRQCVAPNLAAYAERLRLRPYSTLEHMTAEETRAGLAALDADLADDEGAQPVEEDCDLLVLERAGGGPFTRSTGAVA
ncbi:class I SAM-dependent methyltransferase [Streptodolium elevatio]